MVNGLHFIERFSHLNGQVALQFASYPHPHTHTQRATELVYLQGAGLDVIKLPTLWLVNDLLQIKLMQIKMFI